MNVIHETLAETEEDKKRLRHVPAFAPAGQSTQLIVGASPETDHTILHLSDRLYRRQALKRVYYSAYVPVGNIVTDDPTAAAPPLKRENRLYQADWLIRLYGFSIEEVITARQPNLDLTMDPKQAFALRHPQFFPVDVNTAEREMILRVPGIGIRSADRIVTLRRRGRIRLEHLRQMGVVISRALPFIRCDGLPDTRWHVPGANTANARPVALSPWSSSPTEASTACSVRFSTPTPKKRHPMPSNRPPTPNRACSNAASASPPIVSRPPGYGGG